MLYLFFPTFPLSSFACFLVQILPSRFLNSVLILLLNAFWIFNIFFDLTVITANSLAFCSPCLLQYGDSHLTEGKRKKSGCLTVCNFIHLSFLYFQLHLTPWLWKIPINCSDPRPFAGFLVHMILLQSFFPHPSHSSVSAFSGLLNSSFSYCKILWYLIYFLLPFSLFLWVYVLSLLLSFC